MLEQAYKAVTESYIDVSQMRSYNQLDYDTQRALKSIATRFEISNLDADKWVRDAMAAAYQYGKQQGTSDK